MRLRVRVSMVLAQTPVRGKRGEVTFSHGVGMPQEQYPKHQGLNIALGCPR